jgi:hypothetical protein
MEKLLINQILHRKEKEEQIKGLLRDFEQNKNNLLFKKGIYVYGDPGSGKTTFVSEILKEMDYDIVHYDAGDIRNKSIIDNITKHNMSDKNIMSLLYKKVRKIAIIMDEIDGMNNGDKGGINMLIKLIRPKKTKKQKLEEVTVIPIICIGNYYMDKKIKELMKVCNTVELKAPTDQQIHTLVHSLLPDQGEVFERKMVSFVQRDLRKLKNLYSIYHAYPEILLRHIDEDLFQRKSYNEDTKKITRKLLNNYYPFEEHNTIMNETDRTIVGLLWHENIIDGLEKREKKEAIPFYLKQLENMCFADYIDRITFQKQIWQFNEMSSLMKTMKNNQLYHSYMKEKPENQMGENLMGENQMGENLMGENQMGENLMGEIRFTKVLTKYSTEYNNYLFIQNLCQQLGMDKKDLFSFFMDLKNEYEDHEMMALFENHEISKLDIHRIYRYLDKYTKENVKTVEEEVIEELVGEEEVDFMV